MSGQQPERLTIPAPARRVSARRGHPRRGLAPLELVLALPLLLGIMALMVNIGTSGAWKVRGLAQAWREARHSIAYEASEWPPPATAGTTGGGSVGLLATMVAPIDALNGPRYINFGVRPDRLTMAADLHLGVASLQRRYPMLGSLGGYHYDLAHAISRDHHTYRDVGLGGNGSFRITNLYELPPIDPSLQNDYANAIMTLRGMVLQPPFDVLDRDAEFRAFYGRSPDFYPRPAGFCELDEATVRQTIVEPFIGTIQAACIPRRIDGVAEVMTRAFIRLYQDQINRLQSQTPVPAAQIAALQAQIALLNSYLTSIDNLCP